MFGHSLKVLYFYKVSKKRKLLMKSFKFLSVLLLIGLLFASCGNSATRAAKDYCKCWQPLADIANLQDTLKAQNLIDSLAAVNIIAEQVFEDARECAEVKKEKYGEAGAKSAFKKQARKVMKKECPEVFNRTPKY